METKQYYSETELVQLLQKQDEQAFAYLYQQYHKALYNIIVQIVGDTEISNDVLQQVFISIWQKINMFDSSKGRLFTWMLNVSRNAAIDFLRSKANKNSQKNQSLTESVHSNIFTSNELLNIDGIGIKKFVEELKGDLKIVLIQSYYQGFTHEEIAENLKIPIGTVKTRIRTAVTELRKKMIEN